MGSESYRKQIFKFGHGSNLQTADLPSDLWEADGGLYPFQDGPIELYVSSSSAADTGIPILVEGLDSNGLIQRVLVVLNGQTQVKLDGLWCRQYRAVNANHGQDFVGTVYIAEQDTAPGGIPAVASKIKIKIKPEFQQTQMLVYTTPRDYEAVMCCVMVSLVPKNTAAAYATIGMYMRQKGKSWTNQAYLGLITTGTSAIKLDELQVAGTIFPETDIVIRANELSGNGIEISGYFSLKFTRKVPID